MRCEAEDLPVEIELTFEGAPDILRTTEPMPLAGEDHQRHRQTAGRHRLVHRLRLIGRHHRVFASLEEDQWLGEAVQVVDRRALHVDVFPLGISPDETVEVAGLEFVGVGRHRLQIADAEVAGAGAEEIAERQGGERRVATGAPAANGGAIGIDQTALDQILGAVDVIIDVDDAPGAIQPLAVWTAVASAAAVVDVEDRQIHAMSRTGSAG